MCSRSIKRNEKQEGTAGCVMVECFRLHMQLLIPAGKVQVSQGLWILELDNQMVEPTTSSVCTYHIEQYSQCT